MSISLNFLKFSRQSIKINPILKMVARKSKIAATINIKSENGVLVIEEPLNNAQNDISGLLANKYLNESILPLWDFKRGPQWGKVRIFC